MVRFERDTHALLREFESIGTLVKITNVGNLTVEAAYDMLVGRLSGTDVWSHLIERHAGCKHR